MGDEKEMAKSSDVNGPDDQEDKMQTLGEIIEMMTEEDEELAEDADALLGGEDATICSYDQGYRTRQPLYSCRTCSAETGKPVGICLGCSYDCHVDHDIIELYTKRRFKCDCGNSRCPPSLTCKLCPTKQPDNDLNAYNHNFDGMYCTCHRPYPDIDDTIVDEMAQCCVCEDWFHTRHLNSDGLITTDDVCNDHEITCRSCINKFSFLKHYAFGLNLALKPDKVIKKVVAESGVEANVDVEVEQVFSKTAPETKKSEHTASTETTTTAPDTSSTATSSYGTSETTATATPEATTTSLPLVEETKTAVTTPSESATTTTTTSSVTATTTPVTATTTPATATKTQATTTTTAVTSTACKISNIQPEALPECQDVVYWVDEWRDQLCRCDKCKDMYDRLGCDYLIDPEDTVAHYVSLSKAKAEEEKARLQSEAASKLPGLAPSSSSAKPGDKRKAVTGGLNDMIMKVMDERGVHRVGQVEVLHRMQQFKSHLREFLTECTALNRPINADDVREFFERKISKRSKLEMVPPVNCHQQPPGFL